MLPNHRKRWCLFLSILAVFWTAMYFVGVEFAGVVLPMAAIWLYMMGACLLIGNRFSVALAKNHPALYQSRTRMQSPWSREKLPKHFDDAETQTAWTEVKSFIKLILLTFATLAVYAFACMAMTILQHQ